MSKNRIVQGFQKALNKTADISGATSAVKVGGNLAKNMVNVAKGKNAKPLYNKNTKASEFIKDVSGIATMGSLAGGALKLGGKAAIKEAPKAVNELSGMTLEKLKWLKQKAVGEGLRKGLYKSLK